MGHGPHRVDGAPFYIAVESDADAPAGLEVALASYASLADLLAGSATSAGVTQLNLAAAFSIAGFTLDPTGVHLLIESNVNASAGSELYLASFASLADFSTGTVATAGFTQVNIAPTLSVGGFTYDGGAYHLLLETDADAPSGSEVFLATYDSLLNLQGGLASFVGATQIGLHPSVNIGGFAFDAGVYHLLLETTTNQPAGSEVFWASYASLIDLLAGVASGASPTGIDVGASASIRGFTAASPAVPEPASVLLLGLGAGIVVSRRGRRR